MPRIAPVLVLVLLTTAAPAQDTAKPTPIKDYAKVKDLCKDKKYSQAYVLCRNSTRAFETATLAGNVPATGG